MSLKFFDKLSQNFIEILNDKDDYNVIIEVENKEKSFTAHSNVLKFRSSYFRRELENIQPNENNIKIIIKPSISTQIFNVILQYIYGGIVNLESSEIRFIFDLMLIAGEFEFEELTNELENLLIETEGSCIQALFLMLTILLPSKNLHWSLFSSEMICKSKKLKFGIMSSSGRIAQTSTLSTNLEEWSKENFLTLKITLQQCLPHIRYFHLSSIQVVDKIKPYKKIIDKQLWEDINQHLLIPDRPTKINFEEPRESFSTIISEEHAAEISTWIDRKTTAYTSTNIPYKFELILRGTQDGFAPQTFWDICYGHAFKGTDEIIGGYNPLALDNSFIYDEWMKTEDSFIFSLKNGIIPNLILNRVKQPQCAILNVPKYNQKYNDPCFGDDFWMYSG
ncbi:hypothetical protein Glove_301g28 [Diversispora epigaea]|uniref:BTB domain-containing protein n=1 Tax=Diversispora epigaea TaxID=1348612 RepID=A0A397I286_9GLOM|nr:hypothetical protein Glove_301g28 [Diversispora epigaea]